MILKGLDSVSYTHLDVYKRQPFTLGVGHQRCHQLQNVFFAVDISEGVVEMCIRDRFHELVLSDKLFEHCAEIEEAARNRMELIVRSLAEQNGAVSYTHLDVYKRQAATPPTMCTALGLRKCRIFWAAPGSRRQSGMCRCGSCLTTLRNRRQRQNLRPVSYTHLDVYKRQDWR